MRRPLMIHDTGTVPDVTIAQAQTEVVRVPSPPLGPPASGRASADEVLERFLAYAAERGLTLYPAQEEALFEILAGKHVVLATPTGSGKSLVATAFLYKALCDGATGFYSCPVKALVNEKFFDLCAAFGPENVGLVTGDASVNRKAPILVGTAEILANMAMRAARAPADRIVMDEFHYYGDRERGIAWQLPLITLPRATFLLMSATLGDTTPIEKRIAAFTGREVASVRGALRPVPLEFEYRDSPLHETISDLIKEGRAPVYLVNFTQRSAAEEAQNLMSVDLSSKPEKELIKAAIGNFRFDSPYGKELQRYVRHGVGLHHAGLLPRYRRLVERLAQQGLLKVVSGTDTLGVGVNIPIRTVLFSQLCKYDGAKDGVLSVREFLQIAGRAGRKGFDERGWVVAQAPAHVVENKRLAAKAATTGRKVHPQKPPQKGYVHFDKGTFERLVGGTPEPLESRFAVTHGLLLALLQSERGNPRRGGGYRQLLELIAASHDSDVLKRRHRRTAAACFRTLRKAGLIELVIDEGARAPQPRPHPSLQHDFSLHHTLSLYLVDTLALLDPEPEGYALDVLSLVEAILENPRPVLMSQLDKLKRETLDALKAQGMEYEQRIEELDKLEWPKPNRDFIYDTFNAFSDRHPWVGAENIAPKSVAREMLERFCSFHDYVRDYGLQRTEGVLLRYLTDAYRTLAQTVPSQFVTPPVEELALDLGSLVRNVDASLLEEWEALRRGGAVLVEDQPLRVRAPDLTADPRALAARVRTELHRLLGALARRDWEEALLSIAQRPDSDLPSWTADRIAAEMAPYYAEHKSILTTPAARTPRHTVLQVAGSRRWDAQQQIVDPEADEDWAIHTRLDVPEGHLDEAPLIELVRIGR
jgi:superfamily II RNA helicase